MAERDEAAPESPGQPAIPRLSLDEEAIGASPRPDSSPGDVAFTAAPPAPSARAALRSGSHDGLAVHAEGFIAGEPAPVIPIDASERLTWARRFIARELTFGSKAPRIEEYLVRHGFDVEEARRLVEAHLERRVLAIGEMRREEEQVDRAWRLAGWGLAAMGAVVLVFLLVVGPSELGGVSLGIFITGLLLIAAGVRFIVIGPNRPLSENRHE